MSTPRRLTTRQQQPADGLATRADIRDIERHLDRLDYRFFNLQESMRRELRSYTLITIWAMVALTGIFSVIVAVLR